MFKFDFTLVKLQQLIPKAVPDVQTWYDVLTEALPQYDIDTTLRVAAFIAQCGHESGGFSILEENLNYSAQGLTRTWPTRFPSGIADSYARKPQAIANRAYSNRMGNGDEESGDGWKYRGRGIIQLTGKNNYTACSMFLFKDETLLEDPDLLLDPYYATHAACWFWDRNNLNSLADAQDMYNMTLKINGGTIGLEDRIGKFKHAISIV